MIKILKLKNLKDHDVYEFCYNQNYPNSWSDNSIYIPSDDFWTLSPYLDRIFKEYKYDGPQKVYVKDWKKLENICIKESCDLFKTLFEKIDKWISAKDNLDKEFFWILGL